MARRVPWGIVVSVLTVAGVVSWATRQEAPDIPTGADALALIAGATALYALATALRGWRWHVILRRAAVEHRRSDALALTCVGYMGNTVLPARAGELLRIFLMSERSTGNRRQILGSILAERLLDVMALIVLFALSTWIGVAGNPVGRGPAIAAVGLLALGAAAAGVYFWLRARGKLERFADVVRPFGKASRLLMGRVGFGLLVLTGLVWLIEGTIVALLASALDVDMSVLEASFVIVTASFFALVPAAPGYVGTFDAAVLFGVHALDITGSTALTLAVLTRFVLFVPVTAVGAVLMLTRYGGLATLRRSRDAADQERAAS